MNATIQALTVLLPAGYLLLALLYAPPMDAAIADNPRRVRRTLAFAVVALHGALFAAQWSVVTTFPVHDGWSVLSTQALVVVCLYGWIRLRVKHSGTAAIVFGAAFLLQLLASAFGELPPQPRGAAAGPVIVVHVGSSLLASATLVLSGLHGALYLLLYRSMRDKRFGPVARTLPDLELLARMTRGAALAGFVLLGVGLNVGIGWAHASGVTGFTYSDPFVLVMIAIWLHFGLVALSSRIPGITAWRASWAAAAGFVVLVASVVIAILPQLSFHPA